MTSCVFKNFGHFRQLALLGAAAAFAGSLGACTSSIATGPDAAVTATSTLGPPDPIAANPSLAQKDYHIGALDTLDVSVFQVPDLTKSVQVDADGAIVLPLVGKLQASGRTTGELSTDIATALQAKYMQNPQVSVFVHESVGRRITIEGDVHDPGIYPLLGRTSLLEALAMAKGPSDYADLKDVMVFRYVNGQRMGARFDVNGIRTGRYPDPEIYGGDKIIIIESSGRKAFNEFLRDATLFSIFRPF